MAQARQREAWTHTATVLAMIANVNRDSRRPALSPADFDPFVLAERKNTVVPKLGILTLKQVFVDQKPLEAL